MGSTEIFMFSFFQLIEFSFFCFDFLVVTIFSISCLNLFFVFFNRKIMLYITFMIRRLSGKIAKFFTIFGFSSIKFNFITFIILISIFIIFAPLYLYGNILLFLFRYLWNNNLFFDDIVFYFLDFECFLIFFFYKKIFTLKLLNFYIFFTTYSFYLWFVI